MTQAVGDIAPIPSKSHLTRRAALTGMALIAAPTSAVAVCIAPGFDGPDPVIKLCDAFLEMEAGFKRHMEQSLDILDRVNADMPVPDPLIVYGPHAEELKIQKPEYFGRWQPPHGALEPRYIEDRLAYIKPLSVRVTETVMPDGKIARTFMELPDPDPLTPAQQERHDKLTHMLQLSKDYYAEHRRRLTAAGYDQDDDETDAKVDRQNLIERAICIRSATTRDGLLAKIELYESDPDRFTTFRAGDGLIGSILRDTRRMLA